MGWRFDPGVALGDGFRRVATEEVCKVRDALTDDAKDRAKAIHESRQSFKRLRVLLRLARPSLGTDFDDENRLWRDAGRRLAGSRDHTVLMESFDKIAARCDGGLPREQVVRLHGHLAANGGEPDGEDVERGVRSVLGLLDAAEMRLADLDWPDDASALAKGLKRSQAQLRNKWKAARKSADPAALHDWRKRVKDQAAQLRLFRQIVPPSLRSRHRDEKKTAELLGEEHDLWMLEERLAGDGLPAEALAARDALLGEIGERRGALRKEAFDLGKDFSSQKAKAFAEDITAAWEKAARANGNGKHTKRATSPAP
jgi:CHAD domain-containing protein